MARVVVTYSPVVGGSSVISLKESFTEVGSEIIDGDYRKMMEDIPKEEFDKLYSTEEGRQKLFAHAKAKAIELLKEVDVLALSGNSAMIDPELFNQIRDPDQTYDFSRTIAELALVHIATEKGMPILGVCGGHQVVAVYGGGEISDLHSDKLDKQRVMNYDAIKLNKNSLLAQIIGGKKVQEEMDKTRKTFDENMDEFNKQMDEFNKLSGKIQALDKLNALKETVKLEELGQSNQLKTDLQNKRKNLNKLEKGLENHTSPYSETEFFGAHEQVVSKLGTGFQQTGTASDNESIEAAESEFGVPIITTQFHPEVGAKGLPEAHFFYLRTEEEQEMNLNIFRYLDKAGDAYSKKKTMMDELRQFTAKNKDALSQPSQIKKAREEQPQKQEKHEKKSSSIKQKEPSFIENMLSKIGSFLNTIGEIIKEGIGRFLRNILSSMFTSDSVSRLKKKEQKQSSSENSKVDIVASPNNSYSTVFHDMKAKAPSEILRETSAELWTKQEDDLEETIINKNGVDKTFKERITTKSVQEEVEQPLDEDHSTSYKHR